MKASTPLVHKYVCFTIILFTSIFITKGSAVYPSYTINKEYLHQNDSLKIGKYLISIIRSPNNGYGYDIYAEEKLFIHQPTIPALPGNSGFATKAAAEKVARKVVEKIQKGESFPAITIEEMKQLGVIPQ
jgi:hypothetical protein